MASEGAGGAAVASEVLGAGEAGDDDEMSDTAPLFPGASAGGGAGPAVAAGAGAGGGAVPDDPAGAGAGPADPAGVGAANGAGAAGAGAGGGAEDDDAIVLDVNDFTTWDPETFALVPFDKILFPTDPYTSICSVRSYMAVAMIMWYDTDIRAAHSSVWDALRFAWQASFHSALSAVGLEKWPTTGPHAFNEQQCAWLTETLRCLKKPALRRRVAAGAGPLAPAKAAPARKSSLPKPAKPVVSAGKRARSSEPVMRASRLVFLQYFVLFLLCHL